MCVLRMLTFHPLNESKPQIHEKKIPKPQIKADVSKPPQKKVKEEVKVQQPDKKLKLLQLTAKQRLWNLFPLMTGQKILSNWV